MGEVSAHRGEQMRQCVRGRSRAPPPGKRRRAGGAGRDGVESVGVDIGDLPPVVIGQGHRRPVRPPHFGAGLLTHHRRQMPGLDRIVGVRSAGGHVQPQPGIDLAQDSGTVVVPQAPQLGQQPSHVALQDGFSVTAVTIGSHRVQSASLIAGRPSLRAELLDQPSVIDQPRHRPVQAICETVQFARLSAAVADDPLRGVCPHGGPLSV